MSSIDVFSSCCKAGQLKDGVEFAPIFLWNRIQDMISENNINLVATNKFIINNDFKRNIGYQMLYEMNIKTNKTILNLGGDHSIGISTVLASSQKYKDKLKVIWVDAHPDINTYESSFSKNKHGMPVSSIFRLMDSWIKLPEDQYYINPSQFVYIGIRSIDPPEKSFIEMLGIKSYYIEDVMEKGIEVIMNEILESDKGDTTYHLSFDIDAIDPLYMPSTGTPEENGLLLDDGKYIINKLLETKRLKVFDFVEFNPMIGELADRYKTTENCVILLKEFISKLC